MNAPPIAVVGIGADGWDGLSAEAIAALRDVDVLLGGRRHLAMVAGRPGVTVDLRALPSPLVPGLREILDDLTGVRLGVLASGDPMFYGIGATLARMVGAHRLRVIPTVSSATLACARLGWALQDVRVVSLVARPLENLLPHLTDGAMLLVLCEDARTPAAVAAALTDAGFGPSTCTALGDLGGPAESRASELAAEWPPRGAALSDLSVLAVACHEDPQIPRDPRLTNLPGLPDKAYNNDGQLTKQEVRAVTLAVLAPAPGENLWDVGGGAGSIAIEWLRASTRNRAVTFEARADRAERIAANARRLGVPHLVVRGEAPASFAGTFPAPDAIFIGGGLTAPDMVERCWAALRPGGRIVANGVTIEGEQVLLAANRRYGGTLRRLAVDRMGAVGGFAMWRPLATVTQWEARKAPAHHA